MALESFKTQVFSHYHLTLKQNAPDSDSKGGPSLGQDGLSQQAIELCGRANHGLSVSRADSPSLEFQEETQEYASEHKLRELVRKYSEFINFPIYMYDSSIIDVPVEEAEKEETDTADTTETSEGEIEDEGELQSSLIFHCK